MPLNSKDLRADALPASTLTPEVMRPLVEAVRDGRETVPVVRALVQSLGFDSFVYGLSLSLFARPDREAQLYVYTTLPVEWVITYDQRAYIEIDPRIGLALSSGVVESWDQNTFRGKSVTIDSFLDAAGEFGIRSGVCFTLHDVSHHGAMVAFNSVLPAIDRVSEQLIERNLPDILSFGHYFHNWFLASIIKHDIPSTLRGVPLSPREVEVLRHVARGLNTDDIAARMNLVSRTVQLHLDSARAKLGAANRQQALALAIKAGFISIA